MKEFEENEIVLYAPKDADGIPYKYEIGKVKRKNPCDNSYFVYYHSGETASNTKTRDLEKIDNNYYIKTCLGTMEEYL